MARVDANRPAAGPTNVGPRSRRGAPRRSSRRRCYPVGWHCRSLGCRIGRLRSTRAPASRLCPSRATRPALRPRALPPARRRRTPRPPCRRYPPCQAWRTPSGPARQRVRPGQGCARWLRGRAHYPCRGHDPPCQGHDDPSSRQQARRSPRRVELVGSPRSTGPVRPDRSDRRSRTRRWGHRAPPPVQQWAGRGPGRAADRARGRRPGPASAAGVPRNGAVSERGYPAAAAVHDVRRARPVRRGAAPPRPPSAAGRPASYAGVGAVAPPVSSSRPS